METNSLLQILITSIVQGITEFLPISSSGHLFLINKYFEWEEISLILKTKLHLQNDERKKMLMTHYAFFSALLNQKLFAPTRWFTKHGVSHPTKNNRYFKTYREFFIQIIKQNNIQVIYTIKTVDRHFLNELLGDKCLKSFSINNILDEHLVLECDTLK